MSVHVHHFCLKIDPEKQRIIILTKSVRGFFSFDHHAMPQKQTKMDFLMSKFRLILLFKSRAWYYQLGRVDKKKKTKKTRQNQNKPKKTQEIK